MKRTIFILSGILVGVFVILTFADYNSEYSAERSLWKLNQEYKRLVMDPKAVPTASFDRLIRQYEDFLDRYAQSQLTPLARIYIGKVYSARGEYDAAILYFENMIGELPDNPRLAVEAVKEIGKVYALKEDWPGLYRTYERVLEQYPLTDAGLKAPLLIAEFHAQRNEREELAKALDKAALHYKNLIAAHSGTRTGFIAMNLLANVYVVQNNPSEAVDIFGSMLLQYADQIDAQTVNNIIRTINTISITQNEDYDKPVFIYQEFIRTHPRHPFNGLFEDIIRSFKDLKERGGSMEALLGGEEEDDILYDVKDPQLLHGFEGDEQ